MATRILAVLNQKGGVGKTTTCVNLGAALARRGKRVLLIDMDPQANLTVHLGLEPPRLPRTTYSLLLGQHGLAEAIHATGVPGLLAVPSTLALANAEIQLASTVGRELVLREALEGWLQPRGTTQAPAFGTNLGGTNLGDTNLGGVNLGGATLGGVIERGGPPETVAESAEDSAPRGPGTEFVLIDCPPSLGTLTMNALCAADEVLLPIQTEFFALQGVAGILESIKAVQRLNRSLRLSLVVPCMVDRRTTLARDVIEEVRAYFPALTTRTEIRKNVKLAEAPSHGKTIFEWDPRCNGAQDYDALAAEILGVGSDATADPSPEASASRPSSGISRPAHFDEPPAAVTEDEPPSPRTPRAAQPPEATSDRGIAPHDEADPRTRAEPSRGTFAERPAAPAGGETESAALRSEAATIQPEPGTIQPEPGTIQPEPGTIQREPGQAPDPERTPSPKRPWWRSGA